MVIALAKLRVSVPASRKDGGVRGLLITTSAAGVAEFAGRAGIALVLGALVGQWRQWRQRMAGLRTNALVAPGAALFELLAVLMSGQRRPHRFFRYTKIRYAKIRKMTPARSFSPAVEDYLKAIYRLQSEAGDPVTTSALGGWLGVTAPSASGMLKKLDDLRLVVYVPYRGVRLSEVGRRAALAVVRRHRLLEAFLAETLGLSWDKVHDEAEALEHALSPGLCEVIAARLGDPRTDPHGDPIPTPDGRVAETPSQSLGSLGPGQRGRVARVSDRDPGVLRFLTARGIALGDILEVREVRPGGAVTVQARSGVHLLDAAVAAAIRVRACQ